jgi:hypothetical protein
VLHEAANTQKRRWELCSQVGAAALFAMVSPQSKLQISNMGVAGLAVGFVLLTASIPYFATRSELACSTQLAQCLYMPQSHFILETQYCFLTIFCISDVKKSLTNSDQPLTGSQIQRGAYMNTGSRDAGRDPDWDPKTRQWKGSYKQS